MSTYPQDNNVQWLDLAHRQTDSHNYPRSLINVSPCGNVHLITAHWWAAAGSNWTVNTNTVSAGGNQSDVFKSAKKEEQQKTPDHHQVCRYCTHCVELGNTFPKKALKAPHWIQFNCHRAHNQPKKSTTDAVVQRQEHIFHFFLFPANDQP